MKRNKLFIALLAAVFSLSLCFGIAMSGVNPVAADTAAATHTLYKHRELIEGGLTDWIWFSNGTEKNYDAKPLASYKKIRLVLAATRADIVKEVLVSLDDADGKRFQYHGVDLNLKPGEKTVIEMDPSELTNVNGADLSTHVVKSIEFLVDTNKPGTKGVSTYLTAGIQFVGEDDSNTDFAEIEYDPAERSVTHTFYKCTDEIEGAHAKWIWFDKGVTTPSGIKLGNYRKVRIILAATRATMIKEINVTLTGGTGNVVINVGNMDLNMYRNDIERNVATELAWNPSADGALLADFIPTSIEFLIETKDSDGYTADVKTNLTAGVQFVGEDDTNTDFDNIEYEEDTFEDPNEIKQSIKLLDFCYKEGDKVHQTEGNTYVEEHNCFTGTFSDKGGQEDSGSLSIEVTKACDGASQDRQFWVTTGGKWLEHKPASGLTENSKIYFNNFGSVDISFNTPDPHYIENILVTFGTGENVWTGATLNKALTEFTNAGWQHIRFNLDSMTPDKFDWEKKNEFVSLEIVVTVKEGTPIGTKIIFDDLYINTERCDPIITKKDEFKTEYTTGEEVDLTTSVETSHPYGDNVSVSYGVMYAAEEEGSRSPIQVTDGKFTPYRAGYYFVTITAADSLGASARAEITLTVTGDNVDVEDPSISFGSLPQFMAQPGELDLSVIKVTDDVDTDPEIVIEVADENGNKLTIKDGKVNITAPGKYTVTVTATDDAGHSKTVSREVTVEGTAISGPDSGSDSGSGSAGSSNCSSCGGAMGGSLALAIAALATAVRKLRK